MDSIGVMLGEDMLIGLGVSARVVVVVLVEMERVRSESQLMP